MPIKISVLIISLFVTTFSVPTKQLLFLLWLINLHFMLSHPVLQSVYKFKKYLSTLKPSVVKHNYCKFCLASVTENATICSNGACLKPMSEQRSKCYLLEVPVILQIQNIFKNEFLSK